jgi:hypothetical protein
MPEPHLPLRFCVNGTRTYPGPAITGGTTTLWYAPAATRQSPEQTAQDICLTIWDDVHVPYPVNPGGDIK